MNWTSNKQLYYGNGKIRDVFFLTKTKTETLYINSLNFSFFYEKGTLKDQEDKQLIKQLPARALQNQKNQIRYLKTL